MDSIIFDLDGTLWDSREVVLKAWNQVIKGKNINKVLTMNDLKQTMGLQEQEIGEKLFPEIAAEKRAQLLQESFAIECDYIKQQGGMLYKNVEKVLSVLSQKYKLYIVSNCQDGYIEAFFDFHKLSNYFMDYENPGRTGLSKGENIQLVIDRNKLTNPVYVGDTDGDQKAAAFAGIPFVFARYGFGVPNQYDYEISQFEQLLDIF